MNLLHAQRFTHSVPCVIDDASGANFNIQRYHSPARRLYKFLQLVIFRFFACVIRVRVGVRVMVGFRVGVSVFLHVYDFVRFSSHGDVSSIHTTFLTLSEIMSPSSRWPLAAMCAGKGLFFPFKILIKLKHPVI